MSKASEMGEEAETFIDLSPTGDRLRWSLKVTPEIAGATGTLHGGCGLAASAAALEAATKRPTLFISGQYLARAAVGSDVMVEVEELAVGNRVTQAAALVRNDKGVVLRASAALGGHDLDIDRSWRKIPDVPPPGDCPSRRPTSESGHSFTDYTDIRLAGQNSGDPVVFYWARLNRGAASSTVGLIALADLIPSGMRVSLGKGFRGSSLDHAVRITSLEVSEWVLIRIEADAIRNSVGHGRVEIYSQAGQLLATGSQSFAVSAITGPLDR